MFWKHRKLIIIQWELIFSYEQQLFFFKLYKIKKTKLFCFLFYFNDHSNTSFKRRLSSQYFNIKQHIVSTFSFQSTNFNNSSTSHHLNDFCRHDISTLNSTFSQQHFFLFLSHLFINNLDRLISSKNLLFSTLKSIDFYVKIDVFKMTFLRDNRVFLVCRRLLIVFKFLFWAF